MNIKRNAVRKSNKIFMKNAMVKEAKLHTHTHAHKNYRNQSMISEYRGESNAERVAVSEPTEYPYVIHHTHEQTSFCSCTPARIKGLHTGTLEQRAQSNDSDIVMRIEKNRHPIDDGYNIITASRVGSKQKAAGK